MPVAAEEVDRRVRSCLPMVRRLVRQQRRASGSLECDLLEAANLGLVTAANNWRGQGDFPPYAAACVRYAMKDEIIKEYRHSQKSSMEVNMDLIAATDPEDDEHHDLDAAMSMLSEQDRDVVIHVFGYGLTYDEVASKMNISRSGAHKCCSRGLAQLRAAMTNASSARIDPNS